MKKALLVLAICIGTLSLNHVALASGSFSPVKKEAGYIALNASKTVEVEPNKARVTFSVENTASEAQKASYENSVASNKIINALKSTGLDITDVITTSNFTVKPVYASTRDGKREIKNYVAVNSITVETRNTNNIGRLIDIAIVNGANKTDGLYYTYDREKETCSQLYPQLLKDLKDQANTIAQSIGSTVDGIKIINATCTSEGTVVSNTRLFEAAKSMDSVYKTIAETPIEAAKVKIRVYVNADFYVK